MENWKMTEIERRNVRGFIGDCLLSAMSDEYVERITDAILDDVVADVEECADRAWNYSDVYLAIGRAFCGKLGIQY